MATTSTHCYTPLRGKRLRVTELDQCGKYTTGTSRTVTTDGFITVTISAEVEDGQEIMQKNASGALCVNEKTADNFKRLNVEVEYCGVNPDLLGITTNARPYLDAAGNPAGFTLREGVMDKAFALELWMGMSGQACGASSGTEASAYLLLPFVRAGVLGDIKVDGENAVTFSTKAITVGGNSWGVGPYKVLMSSGTTPTAAALPTALDAFDHMLLVDTAVPPPPVACAATQLT